MRELGYMVEFSSIKDYYPRKVTNMDICNFVKGKQLDIAFMAFHHSISELGLCSTEERQKVVKLVKAHCNYLVWLDTADSTGTCLFDVMPYVDKYLKKQLLKNTSDYARPIWGNRTFCEYYHNTGMCSDAKPELRDYPVLDIKYKDKLGVSWNIALSDLYARGIFSRLTFRSFREPKREFIEYGKRSIDVHYRGSLANGIAAFQRKLTMELLKAIKDVRTPDYSKNVRGRLYQEEMRDSKAVISPYGWGEVCYRDFEAFCYGATLIKPSMNHCVTYPDLFKENITYVPISWDFSDAQLACHNIKALESQYMEIAETAKKIYDYYRKDPRSKKEFAQHIISQLN